MHKAKLHPAADFIGEMTFAQSMKLILASGGMRAELIQLPIIDTEGAHRREVAQTCARWLLEHLKSNLMDRSDLVSS